mmetsp:Transcript_8746/g.18551  ORF Transcript_8746/g.18551 Transcript_8746/m.18551 type:complete len:231 (-) Transcript_8746:32-724(-)
MQATDARDITSVKAVIAPYLHREWQVELFEAPARRPIGCLFSGICCCIGAAKQRHELLELTGEPYVCCAGLCQLGPFGDPLPEIPCLCLEVFLCPQMAVSANRFFTQSRFGLMNTPADNALVEAANCLAAVANCAVCFMELKGCCQQCFQIDLDGPCLDIQLPVRELILLADFAYLCLNGCMYAQQQAEIDAMQSRGYGGAPQALLAVLPQKMQALMANARPPQQQFMMS